MVSRAYKAKAKENHPEVENENVLLDSTFDIIAHILRSERCSFMQLNSRHAELRVVRARGLNYEIITHVRAKLSESIAGLVVCQRQPLLIRDLATHPDVDALAIGGCKTSSLISVPVIVSGEVYGVLNVTDRSDGLSFEESDLATLNLLASHLALCIENGLFQAKIQRLANTDGLTGVYNHRYLQERLLEEINRASRFGKPLSLMMIDIDGFKEVNDKYGHIAGDHVLREIASTIQGRVRHFDIVGRYGGDEFVVALPETDGRRASEVAARIARNVAMHRFPDTAPEIAEGISISIGISTYPWPARTKQELIEQADQAMYKAKQSSPLCIHHWGQRDEIEGELVQLLR